MSRNWNRLGDLIGYFLIVARSAYREHHTVKTDYTLCQIRTINTHRRRLKGHYSCTSTLYNESSASAHTYDYQCSLLRHIGFFDWNSNRVHVACGEHKILKLICEYVRTHNTCSRYIIHANVSHNKACAHIIIES